MQKIFPKIEAYNQKILQKFYISTNTFIALASYIIVMNFTYL